jgi:hypothetical protein
MTKKENKQPRDGNGKFASSKPIALYDKNGNVAYFTKEELNGFKNPDCEPATKEYMKCLMRKYQTEQMESLINHRQENDGFCMSITWGFIAICSLIAYYSTDCKISTIALYALIVSGAFLFNSVISWFGWCDTKRYLKEKSSFLKRYTPPACEKKEECE